MGQSFTKLSDWFIGKKEMRIIMAGLENGGKTTILYQLKRGEKVEDTGPTVCFNVEDVEYNNIKFTIFDISPYPRDTRDMWKFFHDSQALVYVVNSCDHERISEARDELHSMLKDDALKADAALLVFANKQDKPDAMSVIELTDALDLPSVKCRWYVQSSCATCGEGLYDGLDWLVNIFSEE